MKKYSSIGELLIDYRILSNTSQADLAAQFEVDIRTILRWEKNQTLLKPEKEEAMVDITFIPYQVIRNLNAPVAIPTYYDFDIRKYSLSTVTHEFPDANWLKNKIDSISTDRLKTLKHKDEIEDILRSSLIQRHISKPIRKELILKATELLPELNFILYDHSGYYSGHSIFFPLSQDCYQKIKNKTLKEEAITETDFVNYKTDKNVVFYGYDVNSDCNENLFFIIGRILKFFRDIPNKEYLYASYTSRHDTFEINKQMGIELVWEDKSLQNKLNSKAPPRLYEGNFTEFLKQ